MRGRAGRGGTGILPDGGVGVGLLDGLLPRAHAELEGRLAARRHFSEDGLGWCDDPPEPGSEHAIGMAGILLAQAPGAQLLAGAVLDRGAVVARLLLGLDWLIGLGPGVICLPLGIPAPAPVLTRMIAAAAAADILVVAAAGNLGAGRILAPADMAGVLSVGAARGSGGVAAFSGSVISPRTGRCEKPDIVAPGLGLATLRACGSPGATSGTSAASAWMAGGAAMLRSAVPEATARQVRRALLSTARPPEPANSHRVRAGAVDLQAARALLRKFVAEPGPDGPLSCDGDAAAAPCGDEAEPASAAVIDPLLARQLATLDAGQRIVMALSFRCRQVCDTDGSAIASALDLGEASRRLRFAPILILNCRVATARRISGMPSVEAMHSGRIDHARYLGRVP